MSLFFWLFILLPSMVSAECAEWLLCPYVSPPGEPNARYVSIDDYRPRIVWSEIEVKGNRALVCLQQPKPADLDEGCTELNRGQIKQLAEPPEEAYFDGIEIKFNPAVTLPFKFEELKRRIPDSAVSRANFGGNRP